MTTKRTCTSCKTEYPATLEYFYKQPSGKDGLKSICKDCACSIAMDYYLANKEKLQFGFYLYQKNNRDKRRQIRRREKAKLAGVLNDNWTDEQLIATYGTDCYICNEAIDFDAPKQGEDSEYSYWPDHVIPYSRGGDNTIDNVRPCHRVCNQNKNTKTYDEYIDFLKEQQ